MDNWFPVFKENTGVPKYPRWISCVSRQLSDIKISTTNSSVSRQNFYGSSYYLSSVHICSLIHSVL
jgi:hypothetical protein